MPGDVRATQWPAAPLSNVDAGIRTARFIALLTAIGGFIAVILLFSYDGDDPGAGRAYAAIGIAVMALTLACTTLLLFLAGWAEESRSRR